MAVSSTDIDRERARGLPRPAPHVIVLFGATGDLARRKLIPGLFHLQRVGLMPEDYRIVGSTMEDLDDDGFREHARGALEEFCRMETGGADWDEFSARLAFAPARADALADGVARAEQAIGTEARRLHYLAVPPPAAGPVVHALGEAGLSARARVIMEKPFGTDLESARKLNDTVHDVFREDQIFRIDHFLGKEAALNMLTLRFANGFLEPVWNREHIDHVQIDVPETLSIGTRGAFYEGTGAYRDMVVTHLLQVLAVVAMEPPSSLEPRALVDEKLKVFRSLLPIDASDVVLGQYEGYTKEKGVASGSKVETFVAARVSVDNWRWAGVPFFLRTGKRMAESARVVSIAFREPPKSMFPRDAGFGTGRPGPPHVRPLRDPAPVAVVLRQAAGAGDAPRQGEPAVLARRDAGSAGRARGLRAPHPRRDDRRPHAVHHGRGGRAAVGGLGAAARAPADAAALPAGIVGAGGDRRADRAARVAPAVRAQVA